MSKQGPFSIELEKTYTTGRRTFAYRLFMHHWKHHAVALFFVVLAWAIYIGPLKTPIEDFLLQHPTWYINTIILAFWSILITISAEMLAVLSASVDHHHLKFMIDEHAFYIHKGLFFIKETNIPYRQISNIHIDRPYHYHLLGLAQFDIVTTADKDLARIGKPSKDFLIPIIDIKLARELSKQITKFSSLKNSHHEEHEHRIIVKDEITEDEENENEEKSDVNGDTRTDEEYESTNDEVEDTDTSTNKEHLNDRSNISNSSKTETDQELLNFEDDFENEIRTYSNRTQTSNKHKK